MKLEALGTQERAARSGATHVITIVASDLTNTTAAASQTIELKDALAGQFVKGIGMKLVTPFHDASDSTFNSVTVAVGDGSDTDRFITATQVNANGTSVAHKAPTTTVRAYLATDTIDAIVTSMSAKKLSDIDVGELQIFVKVYEM